MKACLGNEDIGWRQVKVLGMHKGWTIELGHWLFNPPELYSWCVQWGGAGKYFPTMDDAQAYAKRRRGLNPFKLLN